LKDGWIKLYRKIQDSTMYKSLTSKQRDVMVQCMLRANHEGNKWEWQGQIFKCKPGQFVTSLDSLKADCAKDVSLKNIRTALLKLEKWGFLANESAKTGRIITICNWKTYQIKENETGKGNGKQAANRRQTGGKQAATNKNVKKEKNEKNVKNKATEEIKEAIKKNKGGFKKQGTRAFVTALSEVCKDKEQVRIWAAVIQSRDKKNPAGYLVTLLTKARHTVADSAYDQAKKEMRGKGSDPGKMKTVVPF
jgi:hypothetical protein